MVNLEGKRVFALSEITESIKRMFEKHYALPYWIRAEVSKLNYYPQSGHCYPDLVERKDGKIKAQIRGIIWRDDLINITTKFEQVTREEFREGIDIMFLAYVRFSSEYGLSLQISDIEPLYTLGELAREKMETITRLKKEGDFHKNRNLLPPLLPKRLAVISAQTSKGYSDLIITLEANPWRFTFFTTLYHAVLQGDGAIDTIRKQLAAIGENQDQYDAVLIIRGGGDEIGMAAYDNYQLARDVACFPLPVITGIGHSTNETVVEMVAAVNKITPTDVAHYLIGRFKDFSDRIESAGIRIKLGANIIVDTSRGRFDRAAAGFFEAVSEVIESEHALIRQQAQAVKDSTGAAVFNHRIAMSKYESILTIRPAQIADKQRAALMEQTRMLALHAHHFLNHHQKETGNTAARVQLLDPQSVLKRGFTITRINRKSLDPTALPKPGDVLETESWSGKIRSTVNETKSK